MTDPCIFCQIVAGEAPRSIVYEDEDVLAFLDIAPVNLGQCVVIPKKHFDHFTDLSDDVAARLMVVAQHIGRKQRTTLQPPPLRIGHIVHGFGILHAHLVVVPQFSANDIIPGKPLAHPPRPALDALAKDLRMFIKIGPGKGGRRRGDKPVKVQKAKARKVKAPKAKRKSGKLWPKKPGKAT